MASPVNNSYSAASGVTIHAGHSALSGAALLQFVAGMAPGTIAEYTGTNINGMYSDSPDGTPMGVWESIPNGTMQTWEGKMSYDPVTGLISAAGCCAGLVSETPAGTHSKAVYFDCQTNTWGYTWNPTGKNEGHFYDGNSSRALNGYAYRRGYNSAVIWKMNTATKAWSAAYTQTYSGSDQICAIDVFPEMGASGSLVVVSGATGRVSTIDTATGAQTDRGTVGGLSEYCVCMYVAAAHCVVFGGGTTGTSLYKMDSSGTITQIAQTMPAGVKVGSDATQGLTWPHPSNLAALLVMSQGNNAVYTLDIASGVWTQILDLSGTLLSGHVTLNIGAALHGLGAIALFEGHGRSGPPTVQTLCKFWVYKV